MIFHQGSSVGLNYSLFNFSLSSKVISKHVSARHSSWHYLTIGQLRWKKYNDNRKLFKKVLRTFPGLSSTSPYIRQSSNFFSRNSQDSPYLITFTNLKKNVNSQDYIIRKTVGKLRNRIPLSDIDVEKDRSPSVFEPSTSACDVPTPGQSVPSFNSLSLDDRSNTFIDKAKQTNTIHTYNKDSQESEKSDTNNLLPLDYEFWENNEIKKIEHNNNPDTLILNPQNPDSRVILHFKNKSIQIIEPSNFDHLNLAHQHIMQMNKINAYNKAGRINFTTFEKIPPTDLIKTPKQSEYKSFQEGEDLDFTILKKEESVCLENNSNRCWIPIINEAISPINPQNKEELNVTGKEDANDIHITKIPIKKNTLIEENVIPDKSILNIINSIDKSAVIIQKDLYITNRIIQSIKEEEKNKDKKQLETKGIFPNENIVLRLVAISKKGMTSENAQRLNKIFCEHDNLLNDIMKRNSGGIYLIKTTKDNERLELLFTLLGAPDFQKGPSTTDIINKAAAIIEKEKYHQRKLDEESKEKSKNIVGEERNLKKLERIEHNKSKDKDKCSLPSDMVWGNSLVLLTLCKDSRPFTNLAQCSTDLNMNLNMITRHEKPFEKGIDTLIPTLENLIPEGEVNTLTAYDAPNKTINNLENQGFAESKNNESNSTVNDTKNELSITNGIEQSAIENEIFFLSSMMRKNLDSFECASLVDNSIKCLMSSQAKKGGNQGKLGNNLPIKFPTRNDKTAGGHCSTTNITVFKNNNLTDINISEKEIFTDPRIPLSFSTETSFQIVGSNSKVRKEMDVFEKAKSMLVSSIVQTKHDSNPSNKNILNSKPLSVDLYSSSKGRDKPPSKANNSKRKSISVKKNEKKKMESKKKRIRQDRLYNGKNLPPDINKLEGNADTRSKPKTKLKSQDEDVKTIKEINIVPEKVKSNINESKIEPPKNESEQEISNNNFINNYVHLLQGSNKEITAKPKKRQGITEHKSLSNRDKLILKELIKATKKNKQIKQKKDSGVTKSFSINKKKQLKETFKSSEEKFESSKIKINKSPSEITVKQTLPSTKENEVKPSLMTENVETSKTDREIKIATSDQISKIKKIQTKPEENKQDSNITNTKLDIKNVPKVIKNQIDEISDKKIPQCNISDRDYIRISKRNDGSTSLTFGPPAQTEEGEVSNPPESHVPLGKPQGKDFTFTEIQPKPTESPSTQDKKERDKPKTEILIIEHKNTNTPQDDQNHKEIFKNNLLSKIKSKIESKNPINYRAKKGKDISTCDKKLPVNESIHKKLEDKITLKKDSETSNKNKLNEDTTNKNISKKNISLKPIKSPVKNVFQDKETFNKKTLVTKNITKIKTGLIKKSQEKTTQEHLSLPKARDISDVMNSPNITRKMVKKSKSILDIKQKQGKAKENEEKKNMLTGKSTMSTHKLEQTSKVAQQKNQQTIKDAVLGEPITKGKPVTANQKAKQGDTNVTKPRNLSLGPSANLRNSAVKSANSQKQGASQKEPPAEGIFPTLIVDIDKMNKEIKPNFNIEKCRTCSVPSEKIIHFPIRNSKKVKQLTHSHSVIKVCPSKDPKLNNELAMFPSVTKVLNVTLPKMSKELLKTWWRDKMQNMGEEGFKNLYKGEMTNGTQFHNLIQDHLLWGGGGAVPSSLSFKSLHHILKDIKDLSVVNSHVVHNTLAYRGVVDCVATFKRKPVVIEWKRLNRKEFRNKAALESAFQQLSAYIGAVNFDSNYKFQVNNGLLVLAYNDGSEADHFALNEADCEVYWKQWLERLQRYHAYIKNKSNKQ